MRYVVDLSGVRTVAALHRRLKESLPLPGYYGANLDALFDVLTDGRDERWECVLVNWAEAEKALGGYFAQFRETVDDAVAAGAAVTVEWCAREPTRL